MLEINKVHNYNCLEGLKLLDDCSVDCCVTSPPYWGLRDYGVKGQLGMEKTPEEYVTNMVTVFGEVKRILKPEGTLWLNLGDTYSAHKDCKSVPDTLRVGGRSESANIIEKGQSHSRDTKLLKAGGYKNKDMVGIPWMTAFALRANGWYLRQDIIWHKPNPMPESVTDRCTKSHEYIFLMSKSQKYYFDHEEIQEEANYDGRKDTLFKGSNKYADGECLQVGSANSLSIKGRERWKFKNLQDKGQSNHSFHESRAEGIPDELYAIRNKRDVWSMEDNYNLWEWLFQSAPIEIVTPLWNKFIEDSINKCSVWKINTKPYSEAHFATFPEKLIVDCIRAGCPKDGVVLDPFMGAGTTAVVARKLERNFIGFELNPKYIDISDKRLYAELGMFL